MKRILVLGSGGRESALCWHLQRHGFHVEAAPGNDSLPPLGIPSWSFSNFSELEDSIRQHRLEQIIVGPEKYLVDGIADQLGPKGINIFGPSQKAAQLESDKAWAKDFCERHQIPIGKSATIRQKSEIEKTLKTFRTPYVVKASGLAAGKGVWIGDSLSEATQFAEHALQDHSSVVIEEFLDGEEISYFVSIDGENSVYLGAAQDHKRLLDNDQGPNTGGMGSYTPVPILTPELQKKIETDVVARTLSGLQKDGIAYRGFLFLGLMIVDGKPHVLEFNCRMGDPETQSLMLRMKTSLVEVIENLRVGKKTQVEYHQGVALNIVVAAKGYPDAPKSAFDLPGLDQVVNGIQVFHSGTRWSNDRQVWVANGGRLFSANTLQPSLIEAQKLIYPWLEALPFLKDVHFRKDIGVKAYRHLTPATSGIQSYA